MEELPIDAKREELMESLKHNHRIIVQGETGSGKTTRIPAWALEKFGHRGLVYCTQPRVAAVRKVAERVRDELRCDRNNKYVGYHHRHDAHCDSDTRLLYLTEGVLLQRMLSDQLLSRVAVLVLDEVHERTAEMDMIVGLLRDRIIPARKDSLRVVVVMSATMDSAPYQRQFGIGDAQTHRIEGRCHPVPVYYVADRVPSYVDAAFQIIEELVQATERGESAKNGDVLVFLYGQDECDRLVAKLRQARDACGGRGVQSPQSERMARIEAFPFYRALPWEEQRLAFRSCSRRMRKVVAATNIAETSLTIPGIVHVIDCCFQKVMRHCIENGAEELVKTACSKAQAEQRRGRAGRTQPGYCYRLTTEDAFGQLEEQSAPTLLTADLTGVVLRLLTHGVNPYTFSFVNKPADEAIDFAFGHLFFLGAVSRWAPQNIVELSDKGQIMGRLALDPRMAALLASTQHNCLADMLGIAALFGEEQRVFRSRPSDNREKRQRQLAAQKRLEDKEGGFFTLINACDEHLLSYRYLQNAELNYQQLKRADLSGFGASPSRQLSEPINYVGVKKALMAGFIGNIARFNGNKQTYSLLLFSPSESAPIVIDAQSMLSAETAAPTHTVLYGHLVEHLRRGVPHLCMQTCVGLDDVEMASLPAPAFNWPGEREFMTAPPPRHLHATSSSCWAPRR